METEKKRWNDEGGGSERERGREVRVISGERVCQIERERRTRSEREKKKKQRIITSKLSATLPSIFVFEKIDEPGVELRRRTLCNVALGAISSHSDVSSNKKKRNFY